MTIDAVVVNAPICTESPCLCDEPGEELSDMCVRGSREDPEPSKELQLQAIVGHHVALRPFLPGRHLAPVAPGRRRHPDRVVESRDGLVHYRPQHRETVGTAEAWGGDQGGVVTAA